MCTCGCSCAQTDMCSIHDCAGLLAHVCVHPTTSDLSSQLLAIESVVFVRVGLCIGHRSCRHQSAESTGRLSGQALLPYVPPPLTDSIHITFKWMSSFPLRPVSLLFIIMLMCVTCVRLMYICLWLPCGLRQSLGSCEGWGCLLEFSSNVGHSGQTTVYMHMHMHICTHAYAHELLSLAGECGVTLSFQSATRPFTC